LDLPRTVQNRLIHNALQTILFIAIESRKAHKAWGEANDQAKITMQYTSLKGVWEFLTENHDFYLVKKLVQRGIGKDVKMKGVDNLLKLRYGRSTSSSRTKIMCYKDGKIDVSLDHRFVIAFLVATLGVYFYLKRKNKHEKRIW